MFQCDLISEVEYTFKKMPIFLCRRELEEKMWIQQLQDGPWTCWHWTNMSNLAGDYWAAMEMFLLSIPGTPSIINGQEIGRVCQSTSGYKSKSRNST